MKTLDRTLKAAALGNPGMGEEEKPDISHYSESQILNYLNRIDPLQTPLVESYYKLRLLRKRDLKERLLGVLNYFRSVQKRLAFDVREFYTRERALNGTDYEEALIGPQYGHDAAGNLRAKGSGAAGPGGIN